MDISGIFAISGKPGLFKSIAQSKHGVIVESLIDKKRFNAYTTYKVSALEDITVFGVDEDIKLIDVFKKLAEREDFKAISAIDTLSKEDLRKYFVSIVANYDADRVYDSDIRKILKWYNLLHQNNRITKEVVKTEEKAEKSAEEKPTKEKVVKPKTAKAKPVADMAGAKEATKGKKIAAKGTRKKV